MKSSANAYRALYAHVSRSGYTALVDSSKRIEPLSEVIEQTAQADLELSIVYLVRDVRGWVVSAADADKRSGKWERPYYYYARLWYRQNLAMEAELGKLGRPYLLVSYEHLSFDTEATIDEIVRFAGLDAGKRDRPETHIAYGNRAKYSADRPVVYDDRWMKSPVASGLPLLRPRIFRWNRRRVYEPPGST